MTNAHEKASFTLTIHDNDTKPSEAIIQTRIDYTSLDGAKMRRVSTVRVPVLHSNERERAERNIDVSLASLFYGRRAAHLLQQRAPEQARQALIGAQRLFDRAATSDAQCEEYQVFLDDIAQALDSKTRLVAPVRKRLRVAPLPDSVVAMLNDVQCKPRVALLAGARKKELVLAQKNHIGELKKLQVQ